MDNEEYIRSEYKEIIFYLFFTGFFAVSIPFLIGLAGRAFEESFVRGQPLQFGTYLSSSLIYSSLFVLTLLCIIFPIAKLVSMKRSEHPATKPNPSWFRIFTVSYLHAPEENGLLWYLSEKLGKTGKNNFMRWSLNPLRLLMVSIILFGIFGILIISNPQLAISGVQAQQITTISEISFGALIPSIDENGSLLFLFSFLMGIVAYNSARFRLGKDGFFGIGFFVCIIMGLVWMGFHAIVYSNNDASLVATFIFGFLGSLITMLTGSWISWTIWHISNNSFLILSRMTTLKEDIYVISILFLVLVAVIWGWLEYAFRKRNKPESNLSIPSG